MKKLHLLALLLLIAGDAVLTKDAANSPLQVKDQEPDDSKENSQDQGNQTPSPCLFVSPNIVGCKCK